MIDTASDLGEGVAKTNSSVPYAGFHLKGQKKMREKYIKGLKNGVPGMEIISGDEAQH